MNTCVENLSGYLYQLLHYLHVLSQMFSLGTISSVSSYARRQVLGNLLLIHRAKEICIGPFNLAVYILMD